MNIPTAPSLPPLMPHAIWRQTLSWEDSAQCGPRPSKNGRQRPSFLVHYISEKNRRALYGHRTGESRRTLLDVVQGMCRRVPYGVEEPYYIQRGGTGKMRLFRHRDETAGESWRGTFPAEGAWSACRYTGSCRPTPSRGRGGGRRGLAGRHGSSRREP